MTVGSGVGEQGGQTGGSCAKLGDAMLLDPVLMVEVEKRFRLDLESQVLTQVILDSSKADVTLPCSFIVALLPLTAGPINIITRIMTRWTTVPQSCMEGKL